jgi:hypothetical protein
MRGRISGGACSAPRRSRAPCSPESARTPRPRRLPTPARSQRAAPAPNSAGVGKPLARPSRERHEALANLRVGRRLERFPARVVRHERPVAAALSMRGGALLGRDHRRVVHRQSPQPGFLERRLERRGRPARSWRRTRSLHTTAAAPAEAATPRATGPDLTAFARSNASTAARSDASSAATAEQYHAARRGERARRSAAGRIDD